LKEYEKKKPKPVKAEGGSSDKNNKNSSDEDEADPEKKKLQDRLQGTSLRLQNSDVINSWVSVCLHDLFWFWGFTRNISENDEYLDPKLHNSRGKNIF
jgi:hypothetical protein